MHCDRAILSVRLRRAKAWVVMPSKAPAVAGHDPTARAAATITVHAPFGCNAEQCVVDCQLFASRNVAPRGDRSRVQHPKIRITEVMGDSRSARDWVFDAPQDVLV